VHTVGPGGQRHVESIVDDDARAGPARRFDTVADETKQRPCLQIAFANLNEVDTVARGPRHSPGEMRLGFEPPAVGDHAEDRPHAALTRRSTG
jgi:hypothetical protein